MFGWGYDGMKAVLQELASKGAIYGLGASFNSLVGFLLIPFFTKQLTATEYGRYAIAEMVLNLSLALLGLGMNVAILARYPSIPPEHRDRFFGSILSFMLLWTLFFEMLFLALACPGRSVAIHRCIDPTSGSWIGRDRLADYADGLSR